MQKPKIFNRVICFVIAMLMLMPGMPGNVVSAAEPSKDDIILKKSAEKVGDNTYELELTLQGVDINKKVDIVIILDNSNSMTSELLNMTKDAAKIFVDKIISNNKIDPRISVVIYGTEAQTRDFSKSNNSNSRWAKLSNSFVADDKYYSTDILKINSSIGDLSGNGGGTNTHGAFLMAEKLYSKKRAGADFITLFMTDGVPTYHYNNNFSIGGSGDFSSVENYNRALNAAISLSKKDKSTIYSVGLTGYLDRYYHDTLIADKFLKHPPYEMTKAENGRNNPPTFSSVPSDIYSKAYYNISTKNGNDASTQINEIYSIIASQVSALATGKVIDTIPSYFELTKESEEDLKNQDVDIRLSGGKTILTFDNISAGSTKKTITFEIKAKEGYYGTAYTNVGVEDEKGVTKGAKYEYELNTIGGGNGTSYFPELPVVALNTSAKADSYQAYIGEILRKSKEEGVLSNDDTLKELADDEYDITELQVNMEDEDKEAGFVIMSPTIAGGSVKLFKDGSFEYTPPTTMPASGKDTFTYENFVNVSRDPEGALEGDYVSNVATVTITIGPQRSATVVVNHVYTDDASMNHSNLPVNKKAGDSFEAEPDDVSTDVYEISYSPNKEITVAAGENTITITYTKKAATVVVNHVYTDDASKNHTDSAVDIKAGESFTATPDSVDTNIYTINYEPSQTIIVSAGDNLITVYYAVGQIQSFEYIVNYLDYETGKKVAESVTGSGIYGQEITERAIDINGFNKFGQVKQTIILDVEGNVINFYYTKVEELKTEYYIVNWLYKNPETGKDVLKYTEPVKDGDAISQEDNPFEVNNYKDKHSEFGYNYVTFNYGTPFKQTVEVKITTGAAITGAAITGTAIRTVTPVNLYYDIETIDIAVTKVWVGGSSANRPSIIIQLRDGSKVVGEATLTGGRTTHTFATVPKYDLEAKKLIDYSVYEVPVSNYETSINGYTITNIYTGGGGGDDDDDDDDSTIITDPEVPLAELEKLDHFAYVIGYPEGDVRPLNNITREEVAMIFYRLLTDESRNQLLSDTNPFTDMEGHGWSNRAISTLYSAGIIKGYPDGTFRPSDPISRAEFATIAAKFDKLELNNTSRFTDIFGHWAEKYITSSENKGWIKGYPDMTFKPEQDITRAEAMTLINNVLGRAVPEENIHPDAMFWPDNPSSEWYHEAVMEATNSHDYIFEEDGDELWTGLKANKVWP